MRELAAAINKARTPLLMVGAQVQWDGARAELIAFAEKFHLPVITTGRRLDCFPNDHPLYVGNIGTARNHTQQLLADTDLLVAVGTRMKQRSTANFTLPAVGTPFIQIFPDEEVIGQNQRPAMGIVADTKLALAAALKQRAAKVRPERQAWVGEYRQVQVKYGTPPKRPSRKVSMESVMTDLRALLPRNTIYTMDSGNNSQWLQRYIEFNEPDTFLAPTVGSMGYGVPSAVAAKLAHPERTVVSNCGDGGFLMTGQEMASAAQAGAKIVTIVYNNNAYGTIRMHQEMAFPGRPKGTDMHGADFATLGQGYGALGLKVTRDAEFKPALEQALAADRSALIEVMTDLEQLSPSANLSEVTRGKPGR
jgi:acetolactate synthase-1/2/3 large subunit